MASRVNILLPEVSALLLLSFARRGRKAGRRLFYPYGKTYAQTIGEQD